MLVTGYDDRTGCGYVLRTGPDTEGDGTGTTLVTSGGLTVAATPELAVSLRDALAHRPVAMLSWSGPEVPLDLTDAVLLGWLTHTVGGVVTVQGAPAG